ncbi:fibrillin-2-like [Dreissena polymorpha]|uniref:EGF-like domain-containing protein n=1 Tax=Dreissena polymorpha TaxID=45954 RepID=A0A9D4LET7_DREPO|nr:fibrillin-2-like [Dreissena polymorpha]KAH3855927.1 hypothetical protein DPMN_098502 [Dreissena polymorpha]
MCGLHQHCMNTAESFRCECDLGWKGSACAIDINECNNTSMCGLHQHCMKTAGSFRCDCDIGWEGVNCKDTDECINASTCGNNQNCVNTDGSFRCNCEIGWKGVSCSIAIDECTNKNICGPQQHCVSTIGSFRCDCDIGWEGGNCSIDIDECTNAYNCEEHQHCVNSIGTYMCIEYIMDTSTRYTSTNYQYQSLVTASNGFRPSSVNNAKNLDSGVMKIVQSSANVKGNSGDQQEINLDVVLGSVFGTVAFISGFLVALVAYRKCR